jgi:hypothetical protein
MPRRIKDGISRPRASSRTTGILGAGRKGVNAAWREATRFAVNAARPAIYTMAVERKSKLPASDSS